MMKAAFLLLAISAAAPPPRVLPSVIAQTLSGERVVLPSDLRQPAVLVVGFTKASRAETEPWAERLRADSRISTRVRIYEVSILDGVPGFLRTMILKQMRSGIAPPRQTQFLIVTEAVDSWKRTLETNGQDDHATLMLVQPTGVVTWRSHGAVGTPVYQELLREIGGR